MPVFCSSYIEDIEIISFFFKKENFPKRINKQSSNIESKKILADQYSDCTLILVPYFCSFSKDERKFIVEKGAKRRLYFFSIDNIDPELTKTFFTDN